MDLEVELNDDVFETHQIDEIDEKGYLVFNSRSDVETEKKHDIDIDRGFEKEETNDIIGQVFDTPDDAYDFYNGYAFLHGFGIRIHWTFKNKTTNEPYRKKFVCNKECFKDLKCNSSKEVVKRRRDLRTGCEAFLRISKSKDGKWFVDTFSDLHNHELTVTPTRVMKHRSHGKFHHSMACKSLMSELEWLLRNFLKCMFDKYPGAIITDQDKAIGNAIKTVFPKTRHRYCSWYIKKHEIKHLRPLKARYSDFQELHNQWIKSNTVEEFETRWEFLCAKYNFESGSWIREMYKQRKYWAKAFSKDCFFAGMKSCGRSESIHSFFDGYVNSKTMLNEFVFQYDKAVESRRAAEEDEDFKTMNSKPNISSINLIEAKAGSRYTKKLFDVFKKEWTQATLNLTHETISKSLEEIKYKVGQLDVDKIYWRNVNFRLSDRIDVTCSCAKFETYGMLCKHILYVLKKRHVETLPDHYILPRWTLDARHKSDNWTIGLEDINSENGVGALTLWCVQSNFRKAIERAQDSPSEIKKKLNTILVKFLKEQSIRTKSKQIDIPSQDSNMRSSEVNLMPQISIRDPLAPTITKGHPKTATIIKSSLEAPKKRSCSYCKELGHYISGCPKKKTEELQNREKVDM